MESKREFLSQLSNKRFAFECISLLEKQSLMKDQTVISLLTDEDQCKKLFRCREAILLEISPSIGDKEAGEKGIDSTGKRRYYPEALRSGGRAFLVTNYWYGPNTAMPDDRTPFMEWVLAQIEK